MKPSRTGLPLLLAGLLIAEFVLQAHAAEPNRHKPDAPRASAGSLPEPDYLPEAARPVLRRKMQHHGQDMMDLMLGVTLLQYDAARAAADRIATEPRIVRPIIGGEDDLNAALPELFFVLQDEARLRARAVRDAAQKRDDPALAQSYGRLMEICVSCHSAYLKRP